MALSKIKATGFEYTPVNKAGDTMTGSLKSTAFVPSAKSGNTPHGYVEYNDNVTMQNFTQVNPTQYTIGALSFTIPETPGVSKWRVIASGSWTGALGGNRVWTNLTLDQTSSDIDGDVTGGHESGWFESDLNIPAHSIVSTTTWDTVSAGSHTVRIIGYFNNTSCTCWRRGIVVQWFPES